MIYLLHFSQGISDSQCQHYLGWCNDIDDRLRKHRQGKGARLCEVALQQGIKIRLAELIPGDRKLERRLKQNGHYRRFCPICISQQRKRQK